MLGGGGDGHHRALGGGGVHVGVGAGHHGHLDAALLGVGQLAAQGVGLGAHQVGRGLLGVGAGVVGGLSHGHGGVDVPGLVVLVHLLHKGLVLGGGELVQQLVAVGALGGNVLGVQVQAQQVGGASVAGHDDGVGYHALQHHGLDQEGIEAVALDLLGLGEELPEGEEVEGLEVVQGVAQLVKQGDVHVPAVLRGEVLVAVDGVHAHAVRALDGGGLHQRLGDGGNKIRAVLGDQIVQLEEVAVLGEGVVLVGAPGAGEDHVHAAVAGDQGVGGLVVKIAPGAPDDLQLRANLVGDVLVDLLQHSGIVADVGAVEHDGNGGQIVGGGDGHKGQQHRHSQDQGQEPLHTETSFFYASGRSFRHAAVLTGMDVTPSPSRWSARPPHTAGRRDTRRRWESR